MTSSETMRISFTKIFQNFPHRKFFLSHHPRLSELSKMASLVSAKNTKNPNLSVTPETYDFRSVAVRTKADSLSERKKYILIGVAILVVLIIVGLIAFIIWHQTRLTGRDPIPVPTVPNNFTGSYTTTTTLSPGK